ncbi:MAG: hypothetical protein R3A52_26370 [Polyangiales bacterium]
MSAAIALGAALAATPAWAQSDAGAAGVTDASAASAAVESAAAASDDAGAQAAPAEPVTAVMEEVPGVAVRRGRAETVIAAPFERVAREMMNFAAYAEFMPHLRESRVVRRNRALTDVYMQVPLGRSLGVVWSLVQVRATRTRDRLELVGAAVEGNMDRFDTHVVVERMPDGATRFEFSLLALPRLPFPNSVFSRENRDAARTVAYNVRARLAQATTVASAAAP